MATQHNENLKPLLPGATLALLAILFLLLLFTLLFFKRHIYFLRSPA